MDRLPSELISRIVLHLLGDDEENLEGRRPNPWSKSPSIAQYASISRSWQDAVEMHTFSMVKARSNDLSLFDRAFRRAHRRQAVSIIEYDIVLPPYSRARSWKLERPREHAENMAIFSQAVHAIFSSLHAWQVDQEAIHGATGSVGRPIRLTITVDVRLEVSGLASNGLGLYRMDGHFLDFTEPCSALPEVRRVSELVTGGIVRPLHPNAAFRMVAALSNVKNIFVHMLEPQLRREEMRREHRCALAQNISLMNSTKFSSLRTIYLTLDSAEPWNHSFTPSDCRDPTQPSKDTLSAALRLISQSLPITELTLYGPFIISSELFWPSDSLAPDAAPHWPTLQYLTVNANIVAPDGTYYYTGTEESVSESEDDDPWASSPNSGNSPRTRTNPSTDVDAAGYNSDDSQVRDPINRDDITRSNGGLPPNNWRRELDPERFDPLVLAMSRASCCMPALLELEFYMGMSDAQGPSGIMFYGAAEQEVPEVPGGLRKFEHIKRRRWRAYIGPKAKWEPPEEVLDLWRRFVGPGGVITMDKLLDSWEPKDESGGFEEIVDGPEPPDSPC
ncbi:hypothetical protein BGZ61DRAFT_371270 [Ilyonectria robusta]|uniref:uncharacterized protein n=1 Tax=Ilyonectria robusta TaxID=1079257 RepID=UPI001E8E8BAD|nr:uncharacterized protein BGZ61DRAFT_371270 [Ilyonectria robusta]KAH8657314.1 hypothetical protein BGZ61DRAFT_371270 [Ilyonectria robusta]